MACRRRMQPIPEQVTNRSRVKVKQRPAGDVREAELRGMGLYVEIQAVNVGLVDSDGQGAGERVEIQPEELIAFLGQCVQCRAVRRTQIGDRLRYLAQRWKVRDHELPGPSSRQGGHGRG